jgi:hypothetical protein
MPRKDRTQDEGEEAQDTEEAKEQAPHVEVAAQASSLHGLVKMKRDDRYIHAHPSAMKDHQKNGWKPVE